MLVACFRPTTNDERPMTVHESIPPSAHDCNRAGHSRVYWFGGVSLHRRLDLVRWPVHGYDHLYDHWLSGSPPAFTYWAGVQSCADCLWRFAGFSWHRVADTGFARILTAKLLRQAENGT